MILLKMKELGIAQNNLSRSHLTQKHNIKPTAPKSRNTHKKLIFCTKSGSIIFVSKSYSGSASDRFITEDCNVANKFTPGFIALFDKGFTVQDIFLPKQVLVKISPFARDKKQFTPSEVADAKRIACARIHIEW